MQLLLELLLRLKDRTCGICFHICWFCCSLLKKKGCAEKLGVGLLSHDVLWQIYVAHFHGYWTVFSKVKPCECTALPSVCLY